MKNVKTSIWTKLICLTALFIMLIGTTLTASAEEKGYDEGKGYRYMDSTGRRVYVPAMPVMDENGRPVAYCKSAEAYLAVQDLTQNGVYLYYPKNADGSYGYYTPEQSALLKAVIDAAGITNEMSEYDKCVAINNYVCSVFDYRLVSIFWVAEGDTEGMKRAEAAFAEAFELSCYNKVVTAVANKI